MAFLVDIIVIIIAVGVTILLYTIYYQVFVKGYVRRIKKEFANGNIEKAIKMKKIALRKQPRKMAKLLADIEVNEFDRIKSAFGE